jgi:signal transduction histidine kinase
LELPANPRQTRLVLIIALVLFAAFVAILPFGSAQWPAIPAFIPIVDTTLLLGNIITATLLYAHFSITRSRSLLVLATGYFFAGLIIIPHALTFPGAFTPLGLLGAGVNTTIWFYYFWHTGLPLAVVAYALLQRTKAPPLDARIVPAAILASMVAAAALAVGLTVLATAGHDILPPMMWDTVNWSPAQLFHVAVPLLALMVTAIILLLCGRRSVLDLWLSLMLWAWLIELVMVIFTPSRDSMLWYMGRTYGLMSGVFVLLMLLAEITRLYARLAISVAARQHERESRLMTMDAVAGSIAHEVNQPLAAIVTNASAGLRWLARDPPEFHRVSATLEAIATDGRRAADIVGSIRSMFGKTDCDKLPHNINEILRDAATLVSAEMDRHQISLKLRFTNGLPLVACDRLQMQQVFLNLFTNSIEALQPVTDRRRVVTVYSGQTEAGEVLLRIKDTGIGAPPEDLERIFDPFFTKKSTGTGLGLSICRSIVQNHNGRLWALPRRPHGLIFHVALPSLKR